MLLASTDEYTAEHTGAARMVLLATKLRLTSSCYTTSEAAFVQRLLERVGSATVPHLWDETPDLHAIPTYKYTASSFGRPTQPIAVLDQLVSIRRDAGAYVDHRLLTGFDETGCWAVKVLYQQDHSGDQQCRCVKR